VVLYKYMSVFVEISIVIVIAATVSAVMRLLKQPLIIGHILTGLIVGPYLLNLVNSADTIEVFSQIGIALLLFIVGLHLSPRVIKEVGRVSIIAGLGQILLTGIAGYYISEFFKFELVESLYIAAALTFSSTIIVLKLLSDKQDLSALYGKISIGFLLVQDIVATIVLVFISSVSGDASVSSTALETLIEAGLFFFALAVISVYVLPKFNNFFAKSQEFLFLFSIAWGLGLATVMHSLGLSIEVGALAAGVALSMSPYHLEVSAKLRPLRDFFIVIFFILLGSRLGFSGGQSLIIPALIISGFVLIVKPVIIMVLMGAMNYSKKTSFMTGISLAQISEFSLIIVLQGAYLGHVGPNVLSLITIVGLITIAVSSYMILYSSRLYSVLSESLDIFERENSIKDKDKKNGKHEIILFGYNRIGYDLLKSFKKMNKEYLVIDYNPEVISTLSYEGVNNKYGDASDSEFLNDLNFDPVKMIISTIPDSEINEMIIDKAKQTNENIIIIVTAQTIQETIKLYESGASYVIVPHFLGANHASKMIKRFKFDYDKFKKQKDQHLRYIEKRRSVDSGDLNMKSS